MTKFKQKLIRGLSTFLLVGALFFPKLQAQERVILDQFSQPNDTTLNYYASGDINNDNTITWQDASRLDSLIQGTFSDPLDDRLTDRADINGDGAIDNQDKQILEDYLNQNINYLPAHWNKLNSLEKTSWFEKMIEIDKTDTIALGSVCYEFSIPFTINFHGFESLSSGVGPDFPWKFSKNNRFNIPVYALSTTTTSEVAHAIDGVLIGDNPFEFNGLYSVEPQNDKRVYPGDISMAKNNNVEIDYFWYINPDNGALSSSKIIKWFLDENGDATLLETPYIKHIVKSNPNKDTIPPNVNLSIPDSSYYNSSVDLEYLVKENKTFLDSVYFDLSGIRTNIACDIPATSIVSAPVDSISGTIPLASEEGEYNLVFSTKDIAKPQGNETILNRYFVIDKTPTEINFIYPEANKEYVGSVDSMVVSLTDAHPGDTVNYTINGTDYSVAYSDTITVSTTSVEGQNTYSVSTTDRAGNPSATEVNFNIVPDAVEENKEKTLEDYFKVYPNPVSNIGTFEFYLNAPKDLKFSVFDITGRQLEQRVIEGNFGENKISYDFSKYKSGIYIYKMEIGEGKIKTGRIVRR